MYIQEIKRQSDNEIWSSGIIMWTIFAFKNHAECEKWDKLIKGDNIGSYSASYIKDRF